jgi:DNA-binding transcriptional MocR family regulator
MRASEIRRLMSLAADPSIISFAGGMPNNNLFPVELIDDLYHGLSRAEQQAAFQYGPTPGYPPLIELLKQYLRQKGLDVEHNSLIITTGAQQAINLLAKVFLDPGDVVITEFPSFIGALAAFKSYGAECVGVDLDEEGIIIDKLAAAYAQHRDKAKLLYLTPYFHNPAGIIYSQKRKAELLDFLAGTQLCFLEDDPYGELYFDDADKPLTQPMKALNDKAAPICYVGSFAKIFGPGMRLGWLLGPTEIVEKCELAKQSQDACSSTFTQVLAYAYLKQNRLQPYLEMLRTVYKRRAATTIAALERGLPPGVTFTRPKGGFYIWITMPQHIDATAVFNSSLKKGAAFVIGNAFDPEGRRNNSLRLAFSQTPEEKLEEGITIICDAIRQSMKS